MAHDLVIPVVLEGIFGHKQSVAFFRHMRGEHRDALVDVNDVPSVDEFIACNL